VARGFNPVFLPFNQPSPAVISTTPLPNLIFNPNTVGGFYNPLPATTSGQAGFGTRILLRFNNVGTGVRLILPGVVPLTIGATGSTVAPFNFPIAVTAGSAASVYEVVNSDPAAIEQSNIPIGVAFISNTAQNLPAPGQSIVNQSFAPSPGVPSREMKGNQI
jgi:hypothetical protein